MGNGKKGTAPCGHEGEHVIGTYIQCLKGCDNDEFGFEIVTKEYPKCKFCGSLDVDEEYEIDPVYLWFNPGTPEYDTRCNTCGRIWIRD